MQNKSYTETLDWLFKQFPSYQKIGAAAYKPDLTNCLQLTALFNNPQEQLKFVHIAGTNGKGSTSSMLASILTEAGEKVGLFTSPHIYDFRERIRINGEMIPEEEVIEFCAQIQKLNLDFEPSFFEITWVMALVHFQKSNCSICIIETGLGGRLDATNIITPILSIITNIGLEHTNFLGNTLAEIAGEKAGIIKPKTPVIIGETISETKTVFEKIAGENQSEIYFATDQNSSVPDDFPLRGRYQKANYKIIQTAIPLLKSSGFTISNENCQKGLRNLNQNTGFRGRLELIAEKPLTLLDVSHNYDGIKATLSSILEESSGHLHLIYGSSADKDLGSIFTLFPAEANYYFTEFSNERSAKLEQLQELAQQNLLNSLFFIDPKEALTSAQKAANKEDTILVFGSFFLLSDFF